MARKTASPAQAAPELIGLVQNIERKIARPARSLSKDITLTIPIISHSGIKEASGIRTHIDTLSTISAKQSLYNISSKSKNNARPQLTNDFSRIK